MDGEINVRIKETVRGYEVYIVQPTNAPSDTHLMELLIMIDAVKRASVKHVAAVIPYYGYARQDRKTQPRDPIGAKLVANLLTAAGADRVVTMDLHAAQIQGFFDIPVDNLKGLPIIAEHLKQRNLGDSVVVVSPDVGGVTRARELADRLNCQIAIVDKRRPRPNVAEVMNIVGNVEGMTAILIDDIIDTGGTMVNARLPIEKELKRYMLVVCILFFGKCGQILQDSPIKKVIATNSIHLPEEKRIPKLVQLSIAPLFAKAISYIFDELPVSRLFD